MELLVKKLTDDAIIPVKAHSTDSGFDLFAAEDVVVDPGVTEIISTGIAIQLPKGYEAQIRPRSGITVKTKLRVQIGTIDNTYRGEIRIIVDNISCVGNEDAGVNDIEGSPESYTSTTYHIFKGDKIAQLVVAPVAHPTIRVTDDLMDGERGKGGFGSTGLR